MKKQKKKFLFELKNYIADLIKDGFIYTIMAIFWICGAVLIGTALYCLYFIRDEIIKFFLSLLSVAIAAISICILFAVVALIKRFFDFISDKIEERAEINDEPNISNEKGED